ncbi:MAG TPA: hypothetical protein VGQ13_06265 [Nitrososphaera sp.]|jgi:hypothetical protein|nr:hypothetical protein [Nitrososphaera sp.]
MKKLSYKIIVTAFAVLVATLMATPVLAYPSYAGVTDGQVTVIASDPPIVEYSLTAANHIPEHPDSYIDSHKAFGYAWVGPEPFFGATEVDAVWAVIHPNLPADSNYSDPQDWHVHTVKLNATHDTAEPYCVTQINSPQFLLKIPGKKMNAFLALSDATVTAPVGVNIQAFIVADPVNVTCPDIVLNGETQAGFKLVYMPPP